MNPVTIQKMIEIEAPPTQVWSRIGTAAGLSEWWAAEISMEEREGGHFAESGHWNGQPYHQTGEIIVYDPPRQLLIRLHQLGGAVDWPIHTEIDIKLEERIGPEGETHTSVSIIHRAISNATDAIATGNFTPAQPSTENAFGPTMMRPQSVEGSGPPIVTEAVQATQTASFTLHDLYQWQYQQEARWERCSMLLMTLMS